MRKTWIPLQVSCYRKDLRHLGGSNSGYFEEDYFGEVEGFFASKKQNTWEDDSCSDDSLGDLAQKKVKLVYKPQLSFVPAKLVIDHITNLQLTLRQP